MKAQAFCMVMVALSSACAAGDKQFADAAADAGGGDRPAMDALLDGGHCAVLISPVAPSTFDAPVFGTGQSLRVLGKAQGAVSGTGVFEWTVTNAAGESVTVSFPQTGRTDVVEFPIATAGTYAITARVGDSYPGCDGAIVVTTAAAPSAKRATYQARLTPPSAAINYPQQAYNFQMTQGIPSAGTSVMLMRGLTVNIRPVDENGSPVAGYVRLTRRDTGDAFEAPATSDGASFLIPSARYDILMVPNDNRAPMVVANQSSATLDGLEIVVGQGVEVSGGLKDADNQPVTGAQVVLRSQSEPALLPSTRAVSDANGNFKLWSRPGTWALAINPRQENGLPSVLLPEKVCTAVACQPNGLQVGDAATISFVWKAATPKPLDVQVLTASKTAVEGARVVLEATPGSLTSVGDLTVGNSTPRTLDGWFRAEKLTKADGTARFTVPTATSATAATYQAVAAPPSITSPDAVTRLSAVPVTASSATTVSLQLQSKVRLTGKLTTPAGIDAGAAGGARVLLVDDAADINYPTIVTSADASNAFSASVNPARQYAVVVLPTAASLVGRAVLGPVAVTNTDVIVPETVVPAGLRYAGVVRDERGAPVPGTAISFHCLGCTDTTTPVATTTSAQDGSFSVSLPEP